MESVGRSDIVIIVQAWLLFSFISLIAILSYLYFSLSLILEYLEMERNRRNGKRKKERKSEKRKQQNKKRPKKNKRKRSETIAENDGDKKSCGNVVEKETNAILPELRPNILKGTSITAKKFISIIYNMLQIVNMKTNVNINANVKLFDSRIPLSGILKYLHPSDILKVSSTCRFMRNVFFNTNLKISQHMLITATTDYNKGTPIFDAMVFSGAFRKYLTIYKEHLKIIQQMPFLFKITLQLNGQDLMDIFWKEFTIYINNFKNMQIRIWECSVISRHIDWNRTIEFLEKYHIPNVTFTKWIRSDEVLHKLMHLKVDELTVRGRPSIQYFFDIPVKELTVKGTHFSIDTVMEIIEFVVNGQMKIVNHWRIACKEIVERQMDNAMRLRYNVIDHQTPLPATRPLVLFDEEHYYSVLTEDGRLLAVRFNIDWENDFCITLENEFNYYATSSQ